MSIAVDAPKVPQLKEVSTECCAVVGGVYPHNMISVKYKDSEYISSILNNSHPEFQVETTTEIKFVVLPI